MPGNITLEKGDSGLDKTSVINFSQIATIDRTRFDTKLAHMVTGTTQDFKRRGNRLYCQH
jgi:mRNA-degrading endonuclease toxin of MazEF toxin-antitoxin module